MKTRVWIGIFAAILVVCGALSLLFLMPGEDAAFAGLDSAFVRPYMPEEMTLAQFPAAMYIHDYLLAPIDRAGVIAVALRGR